jgi:cytochrome c-type biogenesis protein CcmE
MTHTPPSPPRADARPRPHRLRRTKQRRLVMIAGAGVVLSLAVVLVLVALRDQIVFFYTPTEIAEQALEPGTRVRLGGLVEEGSVRRGDDGSVSFAITDTANSVEISYHGLLPDLFREGQGVVAEGALTSTHSVDADSVLAKHDERYMPKEVVDALKAQGVWQETAGAGQ